MWLLETTVKNAMDEARSIGLKPTDEQLRAFEAAHSATEGGDASQVLSVAGESAVITIGGVLTPTPDLFSALFGGGNTTYQDIAAAIAETENNPKIKNTEFRINSGGGSVAGLFETAELIQGMNKPTKTVFEGMGASAAYALGVSADVVTAANKTTVLGSIGIVTERHIDADTVTITSTNAPNKRPDATTEEGKAVIREELDAYHDLFVDAITSSRGITADKVNKDFGQGGTVLAESAVKRGMIDSIETSKPTKLKTAASGNKAEVQNTMDLNELKAQHPETYAAAVKLGASQENDRVQEHLILGEASGDLATAIEAAKAGTAMTGVLRATYMAASMKNNSVNAFEEDTAAAEAALETATEAKVEVETDAEKSSKEVWAILNDQLGLEA